MIRPLHLLFCAFALGFLSLASAATATGDYNVRDYGATGDGHTLDTDAINRAIEAAAQASEALGHGRRNFEGREQSGHVLLHPVSPR